MTTTYKQTDNGFMICDENGENIHFASPLMCHTEEKAMEVARIINTYEILEANVKTLFNSPEYTSEKYQKAMQIQWGYYYEHYDILSKVGDNL